MPFQSAGSYYGDIDQTSFDVHKQLLPCAVDEPPGRFGMATPELRECGTEMSCGDRRIKPDGEASPFSASHGLGSAPQRFHVLDNKSGIFQETQSVWCRGDSVTSSDEE